MVESLPMRRRHALLAMTGVVGSAAGSTQVNAAMLSQHDLRDFGARLDGLSDDSSALNRAVQQGGLVFFEGTLKLEQPVNIPSGATIAGAGVYKSRIEIAKDGSLNIFGRSFHSRTAGVSLRDFTITGIVNDEYDYSIRCSHLLHCNFINVNFYHVQSLFDDHHFLIFENCNFFGTRGSALDMNCRSQPNGFVSVSESPTFRNCFFSAYPVNIEDCVEPRFTDCLFFSGPTGIRSARNLAKGNDEEPFYMGPIVTNCTFDSIAGIGLDIEGGGTNCRVIASFFSCGRQSHSAGVRLQASSGIELIGNRFEWCGSAGVELVQCDTIGFMSNSFANMAKAPGILARASRTIRVTGNAFENQARWGGSGRGETSLAIDAGEDCKEWLATSNTASNLRDSRIHTIPADSGSVVRDNVGWPSGAQQ